MDRVEGSYLCPATVMSRCNAQRCIYTWDVRIHDYTIPYDSIRRDDSQLFLWRDVDFTSPRRSNEESLRSSAFYTFPDGWATPVFLQSPKRYALSSGMWLTDSGGGLHRMAETIWAIYRLFLKDEISTEINAKFRPCRQFRPFSAKTARAKALKLYIKFLRLGLA